MYAKIWNYLRGSVLLRCQSAAPERVLNLCAVHEIPFWDVRWQTERCFTLRTTRAGAQQLAEAAADTDARLERLGEQGAPLMLRRMRRRYVLLAALVLAMALYAYGSSFIWDFQVTGNDTVPTEKILRALERNGVSVGTHALSFDQETLRNHVLLELGASSWLSVNVQGCTAPGPVVERRRPPQVADRESSCNVVAGRSGLVTRVEALDGQAVVQPGTVVTQGQLLISGVADDRFGAVRFLCGRGRVYARTWYTLSVSVPLTAEEKTDAVKTVRRVALDLGKQRIKIYGKGSMLGAGCDKITTNHPLTLPFGLRLPAALTVDTVTYRESRTVQRSAAQARAEGEAQLLAQLPGLMTQGGTVTSTRFSARRQGEMLCVTLTAECREQIGVSVEVEKEGL